MQVNVIDQGEWKSVLQKLVPYFPGYKTRLFYF